MKLFAINNPESKFGYTLYTKETLQRRLAGDYHWTLRLEDASNIMYDGDDVTETLEEIERPGCWGVWSLVSTQKPDPADAVMSMFGFQSGETHEYIIRMVNVL